MSGTSGQKSGMRQLAGLTLILAAAALAACERSPYKLTECVDGQPVVERIHDVAPPNC